MNKKVVIISIIICLACLTPIFIGETSPQTNLYVSNTMGAGWYDATHCHTLSDAIDNMSAGDTVYIWNGTYTDEINITKSCLIIGNGSTTVNFSHEFIVTSNDVNISNINISTLGTSLSTSHDNVTLHKCNTSNNIVDINGSNCKVQYCDVYKINIGGTQNQIIHNEVDIIFVDSNTNHLTFANNTITPGDAWAIFSSGTGYNSISIVDNNITEPCDGGIYISNCNHLNISRNIFERDGTSEVFYFYQCSNVILNSNNITCIESDAMMYPYDVTNFSIYNNKFNATTFLDYNPSHPATGSWNISKTLGTNIIGGAYIGGNWWSNYTGVDTDGDGIGNTPLVLGHGFTDYLPLTNNESIIHYHLYVDDDADPSWYNETNVHNISEAITNGSDGSNIYIYNGNYTESSLIFSKNQSFRGQNEFEVNVYTGSEVLILDTILLYNMTIASNFGERILYISSDNTRLDSIYVFGSIHNDELLRIAQTLHVTINNSIFYSNLTSNEGIMIIGGSGTSPATRHLNITNNQIINPTSGIEVWGCVKYMNVLNNTIYNNSNGIYTQWDEDDGLLYTTISYNHIYDCSSYGMYLHDNVGPLYIKHNNIHNNANGISMTGYYEKEVSCDTFSNYIYNITNLGLKSRKFNNYQCYNNTLWNVSDGMNFTFSDSVALSYNYVNASQTGYYLNFTNSEFLNNTAISCDVGVDFYCNTTTCYNNSFYYNRIGMRCQD